MIYCIGNDFVAVNNLLQMKVAYLIAVRNASFTGLKVADEDYKWGDFIQQVLKVAIELHRFCSFSV